MALLRIVVFLLVLLGSVALEEVEDQADRGDQADQGVDSQTVVLELVETVETEEAVEMAEMVETDLLACLCLYTKTLWAPLFLYLIHIAFNNHLYSLIIPAVRILLLNFQQHLLVQLSGFLVPVPTHQAAPQTLQL